VRSGLGVLADSDLRAAVERAVRLAEAHVETEAAAAALGTSGYVLHTAAFATFCFVRFGDEPIHALRESISAGGDTDSIAAILGGWLGALHGAAGLPKRPIARIHDGPFGPTHLRALAACLANHSRGGTAAVPGYSVSAALLRNLALYPVILAHGFRRLLYGLF
jgi:ADP-ribosylglycohydrolase